MRELEDALEIIFHPNPSFPLSRNRPGKSELLARGCKPVNGTAGAALARDSDSQVDASSTVHWFPFGSLKIAKGAKRVHLVSLSGYNHSDFLR